MMNKWNICVLWNNDIFVYLESFCFVNNGPEANLLIYGPEAALHNMLGLRSFCIICGLKAVLYHTWA